jgi:hypothetical protein
MKLHQAAKIAIASHDCAMVDSIVYQLRFQCHFNYAQACEFFQKHTGICQNDLDQMITEGE